MIIFIIVLLAVILIDQISKIIVLKTLDLSDTHYLIKDFLYITKVYNPGAGWGLGSNATWLLCLVSVIAALAMIYFAIKYKSFLEKSYLLRIAAGLIVGGTIGNLIDRFLTVIKQRKGVVDFIGMWIGKYEWPTYNIADAALVVGLILIAIWGIFLYGKEENPTNDEEIHS